MTNTTKNRVQLNTPFEVKLDETVSLEEGKFKISFLDIADSRCPRKTQCITEGEARLEFKIEEDTQSELFDLTIKGLCFDENGSCGSKLNVLGYTIQLLFLSPYPKSKMPDKKMCKAMLIVSKK